MRYSIDVLDIDYCFSSAKILNNAEIEKHFWKINARKPIKKGNQGKNGEIQ
jgi:hypothetical protein